MEGGSVRRSYANILKKPRQIPSSENKEEGGSSTSPRFPEQPICVPRNFEHDWRYGKYVVDREGYSVKVNHFSDDEVSEEECHNDHDDDDSNDDKKKKKCALSAVLKSAVASISKKLPMAMKIGKSSHKSHIADTEDVPILIPVPLHDSKGVSLITFDGYHKKGTNGGYGAMLRHGNGTPIAAVAGGSQHCISAYYHTLEGLKSGLELAKCGKYGFGWRPKFISGR